jgi:formamidopyrimidine-DNA glycosylase
MPELPEVETVVREIRPLVVGSRIAAVKVGRRSLRRPWLRQWSKRIPGRTIRAVRRRGKWIVIDLDGPQLVMHLGMTGQLTVVPASSRLADHTHLIFTLDSAVQQLRFRDVRRFGSATLFADCQTTEAFFADADLGPEPFDVDAVYWRNCLQRTARCLKAVLLDQRVVAGVGNIYADEALFEARLLPTRLGKDLQAREAVRLRQAVGRVLQKAIDKRGSSIRDYVGGSGLKGEFQNEFTVYGRTGEPCIRCKALIVRIVLAGRSTHFCQRCQK